jgi:hypothetical protein
LQLDPRFTGVAIWPSAVCICNIQTEVSRHLIQRQHLVASDLLAQFDHLASEGWSGARSARIGGPVVITDVQASTTCRFNQRRNY